MSHVSPSGRCWHQVARRDWRRLLNRVHRATNPSSVSEFGGAESGLVGRSSRSSCDNSAEASASDGTEFSQLMPYFSLLMATAAKRSCDNRPNTATDDCARNHWSGGFWQASANARRVHPVSQRLGTLLGHWQIGRTAYRPETIGHQAFRPPCWPRSAGAPGGNALARKTENAALTGATISVSAAAQDPSRITRRSPRAVSSAIGG